MALRTLAEVPLARRLAGVRGAIRAEPGMTVEARYAMLHLALAPPAVAFQVKGRELVEDQRRARELAAAGWSQRRISGELGYSRSIVAGWLGGDSA